MAVQLRSFGANALAAAQRPEQSATHSESPYGQSLRDIILPRMEARAAAVGYQVVNNGIVAGRSRQHHRDGARHRPEWPAARPSTALNNREGSIRLQRLQQRHDGLERELRSRRFCIGQTGRLTLDAGKRDGGHAGSFRHRARSSCRRLPRATSRAASNCAAISSISNRKRTSSFPPAPSVWWRAVRRSLPMSPISGETPRSDGSRIYIGEDAYLSVAGLEGHPDHDGAQLRRGRVAHQRIARLGRSIANSWLRGQKIYVRPARQRDFHRWPDVRRTVGDGAAGSWSLGTPLADVSAWVGVGKTNFAELSTQSAVRSS